MKAMSQQSFFDQFISKFGSANQTRLQNEMFCKTDSKF